MINEDTFIQWMGFLNLLFRRINDQGWLIIDDELNQDAPLLKRFPLVNNGPYLEFASDILNMKVAVEETEKVHRYANYAISSLDKYPTKDYQAALVQCIWHTIEGYLDDLPPNIACEYGRTAIPIITRPKREAFQEWLRKINMPKPVKSIDELYMRADLFIESLNEFSLNKPH